MKSQLMERAKRLFASKGYVLARYNMAHRKSWMDEVTQIKQEREFLLNHGEACQIISAVEATRKVPGDLAEVGVAYGASAKLISKHAGDRTLHLFDTFEGLPDVGEKDSAKFSAGQFRSDLDSVKSFLSGSNVKFYKGMFPGTSEPVKDKKFSFIHVDVDLYEGTLAALEFFYPRMSPGAIMISHDYVSADGVNAAFQEFFADKPEPVIELTGYQCLFVKLG